MKNINADRQNLEQELLKALQRKEQLELSLQREELNIKLLRDLLIISGGISNLMEVQENG